LPEEGVVGYLIGREAAGTGEILNLAVDPPYRRQGLARSLLQHGLLALERRGADEVFLEVRISNRSARSLYADEGFKPVGTRTAYYRNPVEDALVLRLGLRPRE
jgi:ribosomal-protein-alanine N-acetyltransferase